MSLLVLPSVPFGITLDFEVSRFERMPDTIDVSQYNLPAGALFSVDSLDDSNPQLTAHLRARIEQSRAQQEQWCRQFDDLYEQAVRANYSAAFLTRWIVALLERQRGALALFHPLVEAMDQKITAHGDELDANAMELYLAIADLVYGWITPYQALCGKLLDLAAERRAVGTKPLRAKPVTGEVDHEALSREFMARFPKLRAALAK
jgi:hypothetical protein